MNKAPIVVTLVTGYALLETVLLLSVIVVQRWYLPSSYQIAVLWAQVLLIPGMAALISRLTYGSYQWVRRTMTIVLLAWLVVPATLIAILVPALVLAGAFAISRILFAVLLPVVLCAMAFGLFLLVRRSGGWNAKAEENIWLSERYAATSRSNSARCNIGIRLGVCAPSVIVLAVFLFFPETWGVLSQLGQRDLGGLSGYRVPIPLTWIVQSHQSGLPDGRSGVGGLSGRGIGLGVSPLRYDSLSHWYVGTDSFNKSELTDLGSLDGPGTNVVGRVSIPFGSESLGCVEYKYSYSNYDWLERSGANAMAHVKCLGSGLQASFDGSRSQLPTFYRMLGGIIQVR
jgi:hypothetical protein